MLEVEAIRTLEGVHSLEPEWQQLWESSDTASPFQSPAWLISWVRHFGRDKHLMVVEVRENGTLVGIAPLCIHTERGLRKVLMIGISVSDYLDALVAPSFEESAPRAILNCLRENSAQWDVCDLQPLLGDSLLLKAELPPGLCGTVTGLDPCSILPLPASLAEYRSGLRRHFVKRLREGIRHAERHGEVTFDLADPQTFPKFFDELVRLHRARWNSRERSGVITTPEAEGFLRETAAQFLSRGGLRLFVMRVGEQPVASIYGFVHRRRIHLYLSGFDPAFEKASPGMQIISHAIERSISEGIGTCDFLRGQESYKYRWNIHERPTFARSITVSKQP